MEDGTSRITSSSQIVPDLNRRIDPAGVLAETAARVVRDAVRLGLHSGRSINDLNEFTVEYGMARGRPSNMQVTVRWKTAWRICGACQRAISGA